MQPFNFVCKFCNHANVVTDANYQIFTSEVKIRAPYRSANDTLNVEIVDCQNPACKRSTLTFCVNMRAYRQLESATPVTPNHFNIRRGQSFRKQWNLIPDSTAKVFPDYIPAPIRADYEEASLIADASPKAAATLARRCLQGMIRDFHGVCKKRLVDEIDAINDKVDPLTWDAIDAVRRLGNIGAHMEQDVNVIIDIEPGEARQLIALVETLIDEWYVTRHERQIRMDSLIRLGDEKSPKKG